MSEDPFDNALAFFERAAPPSPLRAGAPAWLTPGLLRSPLHHQSRRSGSSHGAYRSGLVRGRRSRPGQVHAGGPRSEGAESRGSKLPCGSLDGTREPSSARLRPAGRGSGTVKECQSLVEGIFGLLGFRALPMHVVRGRRPICWMNFTMQNVLFLINSSPAGHSQRRFASGAT